MEINENSNWWVIRPKPDGKDRTKEFRNNNIVAIGWPYLGNLGKQTNKEIRSKLKEKLSSKTDKSINLQFGMIRRFKDEIKKGDVLVVPESGNEYIHIAKVKSDYLFDKEKINDGYPHQKEVSWL